MTSRVVCRALLPFLVVLVVLPAFALAEEAGRIQIHPDFSEADAVLAILAKRSASQTVTGSDWESLFVNEPYQRLKKREASMHRDFTDDEFKKFILSDALLKQRDALAHIVLDWKQADLHLAAARVLQYLPAESVIRTKVFPVIKPVPNSFVFDMDTDPAIFLYVDTAISSAAFQNTVAHEMHHIGLSSVDKLYEQKIASLPPVTTLQHGWVHSAREKQCLLRLAPRD
jgi:hypothetical protein